MEDLIKAVTTIITSPSFVNTGIVIPQSSTLMPIESENFHPLPSPCQEPCTFIDGGIGELILSANFGVYFTRIVALSFIDGKKKVYHHEFYTLLSSSPSNNYTCKFFSVSGELLLSPRIINSGDPRFSFFQQRSQFSTIANYYRRLAELIMTQQFSPVILDGSLLAQTDEEQSLIQPHVVAVSKTCSWLTNQGQAALIALRTFTTKQSWYYYQEVQKYYADIIFAKFHPSSKYIFKIERPSNAVGCISQLLWHSQDLVFLGYPYGLVLVDRLARVSEREINALRVQFRMKCRDYLKLYDYLSTLDAHSILDTI